MLAIFAVHTNLNSDSDVVVLNAAQKQRIQDAFWAMHEITYEVEEVDTTPEPTEDEPDPEPVTEYILHITVSSKSVDALADLYRFILTKAALKVFWHFQDCFIIVYTVSSVESCFLSFPGDGECKHCNVP